MTQHRKWPSKVWIVRHGESVANVALRSAIEKEYDRIDVVGRDANIPLSERGELQARAVGSWFRDLPQDDRPERVLSSPFRRARQTAELIIAEGGLDVDLQLDERLREKELGSLGKLTHKGLEHLEPTQALLQHELGKFYYRPPGGESWCDIISRLRSLLYNFVLHEDQRRVLFVCHQAVTACLRYIFEHLDEEAVLRIDRESPASNCGISQFNVSDESGRARMRLVCWNLDPGNQEERTN